MKLPVHEVVTIQKRPSMKKLCQTLTQRRIKHNYQVDFFESFLFLVQRTQSCIDTAEIEDDKSIWCSSVILFFSVGALIYKMHAVGILRGESGNISDCPDGTGFLS
jgi:hypothetical protein